MLNRKKAPEIKDAIHFDYLLQKPEIVTLDNGVKTYSIVNGTEDVVSLECVFYAGNWHEELNIQAAAANYLLKSGTSTKTAFEINERFEYYGTSLQTSCGNEFATLSIHCLSKHLAMLLPIMGEVLNETIFPADELALFKQNKKQALQVSLKKSHFVANRLIDAYLFGENHPYGKYSTSEAFDALDVTSLKRFYEKYYQNGQCIIFIAGKPPKNYAELIQKYLGNLTCNEVKLNPIEAQPALQKKYRIQNDENGMQGSIRLSCPFPNKNHPDYIKCQFVNTILGGYFGSRLMLNIRENKGYTYGIHSQLHNHIFGGAWHISSEAGKDVAEAAVNETYIEMAKLRETLVPQEELLLVKNYILGQVLGDLDGPFQIIRRWKNIVLHQLDEGYFDKAIEAIKSISAEEVQHLAQKYLQPDDFYDLIVV